MLFDPIYMLVLALTGLVSLGASITVKRRFKRWGKVPTAARMTGAEVAREILNQAGIFGVTVERTQGVLSDHYDPTKKALRLSPQVYDESSVAAVGVAAHEVGHAIQHANAYWPLQVRTHLAPAAAFGSNISTFAIMGGFLLGSLGLVKIGVLFFALMVGFVILTLPVEFDASRRAMKWLPALGLTSGREGQGVAAVLNAAAMTYIAAAVAAIAQLLYFLWISGLLGGGDD